MLEVELGGNPKIGRFTDSEFRCLVCGVWPLAAKSPVRGRLLVAGHPVDAADVAHQARCSLTVARRTLEKMRALDMLDADEEYGCERVHDWDQVNPAPKEDPTNAERQARYRERRNAERNAGSNGAVTSTEVEVEVNEEPIGSSRPEIIRLCHLLADLILQRDPKAKVKPNSQGWQEACRRLLDVDGRTEGEVERVIRWCQADGFWQANVLSMPKLRDKFDQLAMKSRPSKAGPPADAMDRAKGWLERELPDHPNLVLSNTALRWVASNLGSPALTVQATKERFVMRSAA